MRLDKYFHDLSKVAKLDGNYQLEVIGNGRGLTNVPKGAKGTITSVKEAMYTIKWPNGIVEEKSIAGGMAMDLDVVPIGL